MGKGPARAPFEHMIPDSTLGCFWELPGCINLENVSSHTVFWFQQSQGCDVEIMTGWYDSYMLSWGFPEDGNIRVNGSRIHDHI